VEGRHGGLSLPGLSAEKRAISQKFALLLSRAGSIMLAAPMKRCAAIFLMLLALFLGGFEIIALIDPVGTQMANDADPFGPPPPWPAHAVMITAILVLTASSVVLWQAGRRREIMAEG
jgi:hypothetical protein